MFPVKVLALLMVRLAVPLLFRPVLPPMSAVPLMV